MKKTKDILVFGTFGWGVTFAILFSLYRYYIQENYNPPFGSWYIFIIICLVGGTVVGYFSSKTKKDI